VVVAVASAVLALLTASTLAMMGTGEDGVGAVIRLTARTSVLLFTAAFTASALRRLWPTPATRWLLRRRRQVGLSFAVSHGLHLAAIVTLATRWPDVFWPKRSVVTLVFGGIAYVFILLMAVTSNDASVRALGGKRWGLLHTVGAYWIWTIFFVSYVPRALTSPAYVPLALLVVAALGLRLIARRAAAPVLSDRPLAG
jgi:DMSO/TMAO reductase YedYZ heme-binding membrane subunit